MHNNSTRWEETIRTDETQNTKTPEKMSRCIYLCESRWRIKVTKLCGPQDQTWLIQEAPSRQQSGIYGLSWDNFQPHTSKRVKKERKQLVQLRFCERHPSAKLDTPKIARESGAGACEVHPRSILPLFSAFVLLLVAGSVKQPVSRRLRSYFIHPFLSLYVCVPFRK